MTGGKEQIMRARRFITGGKDVNAAVCCSCGVKAGTTEMKRAIKTTFTDFPQLVLTPSTMICAECERAYNDKNLRFKPIYSNKRGEYRIIERTEVLDLICNPQEEWVLSVPYSFKKHHWLYAGLSNRHMAYIGTDDRTIIIEYDKINIAELVNSIKDCIAYGVPRKELKAGIYSVFTLVKFPFLNSCEELFEQVRPSGLIDLIVQYTPAVKNKKTYERKEENTMLTSAENNAVTLLGCIAKSSKYRVENGLQFWDGFFERRINRFKSLGTHEFVSKLSEAVGSINNGGYAEMVRDMSEDDLNDMMTVIRSKTHLIVAIVYAEKDRD